MTTIRHIFLAIIVSVFSATAVANSSQEAQGYFASLVSKDLLQVQVYETKGKSPSQIERMNEQNFKRLENYSPRPAHGRVQTIPSEYADLVYYSINQHPIVSEYHLYDYRNGLQIGFCFGRAAYVHLALLRSGVNKRSIKKIWAVGPMNAGGIDWQFHVATIALLEDGQWYAIDTFQGQVKPVREWFRTMQGTAKDKSLRFYVTEPSKFSVSLGEYSRLELGLDLSEDQDWYSHYFKKLMNWTATKPLSDVGLYDLRTQK